MNRIYGNDASLQLIRTMTAADRLPHACLLYGSKGMGRKTLARYYAMTALCTGPDAPCGTCRSCRKVMQDIHPDLIWVEHSGKRQGFSVETVRDICKDAITAPNDGSRRVYIFTDCDNMDVRPQNTLLKLTEEPPAHVLLLFTALHPQAFLETMRSRMMQIALRPCTQEECCKALTEQGCTPEDAQRAAAACGGNIGMALDWLHSESMQEMTAQAAALTRAAAGRHSYEILRILAQYEQNRQDAAEFLRLFDLQIRDALTMKYGAAAFVGCDRQSAQALSGGMTLGNAVRMHEAVQDAYEALDANVSVRLALATLGGRLMMKA